MVDPAEIEPELQSEPGGLREDIPQEDRQRAANVDPRNLLSPEQARDLQAKLRANAQAKEFHGPSKSWFNRY